LTVFVELDKELERKFRIRVAEKFGGQKGATKKAVEEAIKLWLKS
jgi:hypothetical protein